MALGKRTGCGWTDSPSRTGCLVAFALLVTLAGTAAAETWRGLTVAPENRCSAYDEKRDYP